MHSGVPVHAPANAAVSWRSAPTRPVSTGRADSGHSVRRPDLHRHRPGRHRGYHLPAARRLGAGRGSQRQVRCRGRGCKARAAVLCGTRAGRRPGPGWRLPGERVHSGPLTAGRRCRRRCAPRAGPGSGGPRHGHRARLGAPGRARARQLRAGIRDHGHRRAAAHRRVRHHAALWRGHAVGGHAGLGSDRRLRGLRPPGRDHRRSERAAWLHPRTGTAMPGSGVGRAARRPHGRAGTTGRRRPASRSPSRGRQTCRQVRRTRPA